MAIRYRQNYQAPDWNRVSDDSSVVLYVPLATYDHNVSLVSFKPESSGPRRMYVPLELEAPLKSSAEGSCHNPTTTGALRTAIVSASISISCIPPLVMRYIMCRCSACDLYTAMPRASGMLPYTHSFIGALQY
jgi:hypothetical protein